MMNHAVWAEDSFLPEFEPLNGDKKTDVLVIGGGLTGLLCAYKLRQSGTACILIEADRICSGISGSTTAKITSQHGLIYDKLIREYDPETAYGYWQANEEALAEYRRLCGQFDCDFERKNAWVYTLSHPKKIEKEWEALHRLGIPAVYTKQVPLPVQTAGAIGFRDQAQFHPLKFAAAIAKELTIFEHTAAREFIGNTVLTDRGKITAEKIIVATHFPILNKHGCYFLKLYQHRSYVLALENAPEVNGMYIDESGKGLSFRDYKGLLLLGGGAHRTGKSGGTWHTLEQFAAAKYPAAKVKYRWAAQDCMSLDGIPYIGRYSRNTPGLYVATGFNKWGMTGSMAAAMLLSDLVQGRDNPYEELFSPTRAILHPQLGINALEAMGNLLTFTRPRCPHLGCALKWNPQEHSWDCPCHGSRFTEEGRLLDNPATGDLKLH